MEQTLRTFIAIKILPGNRFNHIYSALQENLKHETIHWIPKNNFHLTLRFLGETAPSQIENISIELENIAHKFSSFQFNLKGLGFFKRKGKPQILYAKIEYSPTLILLAEEIERSMLTLGFKEKIKEFKPHLTLGKIKHLNQKDKFLSFIQKSEETHLQKVTLSEIIFYQSIIHSDGPEYKAIKNFKFNK